ncbi:MAG TPA: hypothetical protein VHX67_00125 [Acidimicrobiales bacterium]|jgi:hypothetical protein|nr:hypothetical protein [Acidimicrobiales bacterium]
MPWLITTPGWPALAAHLAGVTAHVMAGPAPATGAAAGAVACAAVVVRRARTRQRAAGPTT